MPIVFKNGPDFNFPLHGVALYPKKDAKNDKNPPRGSIGLLLLRKIWNKIMGDTKVLHGPLAVENGWQWAVGIEEGAKEKYKEPTIVMISNTRLEVRYFDENAVCLEDCDLRNANYRSTEASERCEEVLRDDGWTFL